MFLDDLKEREPEQYEKTMKKAWSDRQKGVLSIREISDYLCVDRLSLIEHLEAWLA